MKGAPETVLARCCDISPVQKKEIPAWIEQESASGRRVIAVATKKILLNEITDSIRHEDNLRLSGLISFTDPVKKTARQAVAAARHLGITVKVLTGDSAATAGAISTDIGLINKTDTVATGEWFESLSLEKQREAVRTHAVFARVSPEQKFAIITLLEETYEVGFLGEGVNDGPALKKAHVGIAVSHSSDVAYQSADIILLKKSLHVIVDGICEGREIFANTTKYIRATLSSNLGNFYTIAFISLFIDFFPFLPLQILLVNLLTDFPLIAVAADTVDQGELKKPRSYDVRSIALLGTVLGIVSSVFDFIFFAIFIRFSPQVFQTNWFMGSVLTELVFLFSIRTRLPFLKAKRPALILVVLTVVAMITTIFIPYTSLGTRIFSFVPPQFNHVALIVGIVAIYFILTEQAKLLAYRLMDK